MIGSTKWLISLDKNRKLIKERREEVNWLFISFSWHFLNAHSQLSTLICQFVVVLHVQLSKHLQYFIFKEEIIEILAAAASLFILVAVVCVSHLHKFSFSARVMKLGLFILSDYESYKEKWKMDIESMEE